VFKLKKKGHHVLQNIGESEQQPSITATTTTTIATIFLLSPVAHVHRHGAGLPQAGVDQHGAVRPVQLGYLDGVAALVAPVEVPRHPVHRQAVGVAERRAVENLEGIGTYRRSTSRTLVPANVRVFFPNLFSKKCLAVISFLIHSSSGI